MYHSLFNQTTIKGHNSFSPVIFLVPHELLILHQRPGKIFCKSMSLFANLLRGCLSFQPPSISPWQTEFSLIFIAKCCGNSSSLHRSPGLGSPGWDWDSSLFQRGVPPPQRCPLLGVQPLSVCLGSAHFESSPLLPVLISPLLYIFSYRGFVQLVFRWFLGLIILLFICNSDVILEGSRHKIYLIHHLVPS